MVRNYVINVIDRVTGATRFVRGIVHQIIESIGRIVVNKFI